MRYEIKKRVEEITAAIWQFVRLDPAQTNKR